MDVPKNLSYFKSTLDIQLVILILDSIKKGFRTIKSHNHKCVKPCVLNGCGNKVLPQL